ncbi:MAG TPA: hypothetical protein VHR97_01690 [Candidatus Baltobacteraceae bacterium]|nr:hypothetical protein [Candidatus Baltobacteraceae bacterium]
MIRPFLVALVAVAALITIVPQRTVAQVPVGTGTVALTAACTSDPCGATSVAVIQVPGGSSTCTVNAWGTYLATAVFEVTNTTNGAVLAQWQPVSLSPASGGISGAGFGTSTSRALSFYGSAPLRATQALRVRVSAYTSGTINVQLSCAGSPENIQTVPGISPSASPTP